MHKINTCFILNYAPHYREEIFLLMGKELNCDFYFGDKTYADIKKIDYSKFDNEVKELKFHKLFSRFYYLKGQFKLSFKNYNYYVIAGQPYNISSWLLLLINRLRGKKTYIWNHGWYGNENSLKRYLKKIHFKLISGYFLYGNYAKELMIKEGFAKNKLHVVYNSLYYSKQLKVREKLKLTNIYKDHFKNDYPTLLFIGRLTAIKKLDLLIKAMKTSYNEEIYFNLVFIGTGNEKENLQKLVTRLDINSNVWFYGECYEENSIGELIFNANLCVSPGNIGLTAIHCLTYGTPALTHNNFSNQMPEFEAIQVGITGLFFEENNIDSLKQAIQNWLSEYPKKSNELIKNCFSIIDTYYNPYSQIRLFQSILK